MNANCSHVSNLFEWKLQQSDLKISQRKEIKFIIETGIKTKTQNKQTKEIQNSCDNDQEVARKLRERISIKNLIHSSS